MKDSQAMRLAEEMDRLRLEMWRVAARLEKHQNGSVIARALRDRDFIVSGNVRDVVREHLSVPNNWRATAAGEWKQVAFQPELPGAGTE